MLNQKVFIPAIVFPWVVLFVDLARGHFQTDPASSMPVTQDDVKLHVDAEFQMHAQDCVLVSVWTRDSSSSSWTLQHKLVECGRGLVPLNPFPGDGGGGAWFDETHRP